MIADILVGVLVWVAASVPVIVLVCRCIGTMGQD